MKTRRWMTSILEQAKKAQPDLPWARPIRAARRVEKPRKTRIKAAV